MNVESKDDLIPGLDESHNPNQYTYFILCFTSFCYRQPPNRKGPSLTLNFFWLYVRYCRLYQITIKLLFFPPKSTSERAWL